MNDESKQSGAVDRTQSEKQSQESDIITLAVQNIWGHTPSAATSYSRQAVRQANFKLFLPKHYFH